MLGLPPDLVDMDDTHGFKDMEFQRYGALQRELVSVLDTTEESSDYWAFHDDVIQASEAGDVAALQAILRRSTLAKINERFARSMAWTRREALGIASSNGSVPLMTLWLDNGGLELSDRCFDQQEDRDPFNVGGPPTEFLRPSLRPSLRIQPT